MGEDFNRVTVAVVQTSPVLFDREATVEKTCRLVVEVAEQGADLVLFPEAFIPAYPRGLGFGAVVGSRSPEGRRTFQRYWANAVQVPGPATEALGKAAREAGIYLSIGVIERDSTFSRGTLYCTLLYFNPEGELMGKHRKLKPTASERLIWGEGDGSTMPVFDTPLGRIGGLICWENYMPLARMAMYGKGVEIYLAPTADHRETWESTLRHIACEGRCFVIGCNQFVTKDMYPEDLEGLVDSATFQKLRKGKQGGTLYKQPGCRPFVEEGSGTRHTLEESLAWNEDAFKDFAKALAGSIAGMSKVLAVYRRYRQSYSDLVRRIAATDRLIDLIVYRLYGLSEDEVAVVEGTPPPDTPTSDIENGNETGITPVHSSRTTSDSMEVKGFVEKNRHVLRVASLLGMSSEAARQFIAEVQKASSLAPPFKLIAEAVEEMIQDSHYLDPAEVAERIAPRWAAERASRKSRSHGGTKPTFVIHPDGTVTSTKYVTWDD